MTIFDLLEKMDIAGEVGCERAAVRFEGQKEERLRRKMQEKALRSAAPHGGGLRLGKELLSLVAERGDGEIGGGHKRIINELTSPLPLSRRERGFHSVTFVMGER